MAQNFTFFAYRLAAVKISTLKFFNARRNSGVMAYRVQLIEREDVEIKTVKFFSIGLTSNSTKIGAAENFPLYGISFTVAREKVARL